MKLLILGFHFFRESVDRCILDIFCSFASSYFFDSYWLNSSRKAGSGN